MQNKLLVGLIVVVFSIVGVFGYVIVQSGGSTPVLTTNTSNLIPEAALETNTYTSLPKREICTECAGTGWSRQIACLNCEGYGVLNCTACNGTGEYLNGTICSYCHGTGQIICPECHGTGGTKCEFCGGDGYYDPEKGDKKAQNKKENSLI